MQLQINADEIFELYKAQLAEMNHDLHLERLKTKKLAELVEQYERAEADRTRMAADKRLRDSLSASQDPVDLPPPPQLPSAPTALLEPGEGA